MTLTTEGDLLQLRLGDDSSLLRHEQSERKLACIVQRSSLNTEVATAGETLATF